MRPIAFSCIACHSSPCQTQLSSAQGPLRPHSLQMSLKELKKTRLSRYIENPPLLKPLTCKIQLPASQSSVFYLELQKNSLNSEKIHYAAMSLGSTWEMYIDGQCPITSFLSHCYDCYALL